MHFVQIRCQKGQKGSVSDKTGQSAFDDDDETLIPSKHDVDDGSVVEDDDEGEGFHPGNANY